MAQVKDTYNLETPPTLEGDVVYHSEITEDGKRIAHYAIHPFTKVLSTYYCTPKGNFLMRQSVIKHPINRYAGFRRLAVSVSTVGFALTCGIIGIALSSEGTKNLTVESAFGILAILACTVIIPMGTYYGLRWIAEGFKGK